MSAAVSARAWRAATAWLTHLACAVAVLIAGARVAGAQFLEFRPPPPAQATGSVPVTIAFGGPVGADGGCYDTDPSAIACQSGYYYPYNDAVQPSAVSFTVNGVNQTATLSVSGPVDDNCWYGDYNSYECTRTYTATGTVALGPGQNTLTAAAASYGLSQTAYVSTGVPAGSRPRSSRPPCTATPRCARWTAANS